MNEKKTSNTFIQLAKDTNTGLLLVGNNEFTGENQVTRRSCSRPRYF